eukprot:TRINITY_DN1336_c0_g1_i1.p1 TRINITY_DN1336_c0_g1~~TRINITY_DN1336_c0_g1_i1.p1  ORF type:complete len:229 (-),score=72.28 TRINITY_DN1336_c0_g1_i1:22-657(-)
MSNKLVLQYFPMGGRAEAIRFALFVGGVEFEDLRLPFQEFGKKKQEGAFPYGSIPTLTIGDFQLGQSNSILRYAGKLGGLYPSDPLESAKVDELLDTAEDVTLQIAPSLSEKDVEKKKNMREVLANETLPKWFGLLEKRISLFSGDGVHAVGKSLTIADLKLACLSQWFYSGALDHIPKDIVDGYKNLKAIHTNVYNNPKVKQWLENVNKK